jgi:DNA-binding NtrC family response regulator
MDLNESAGADRAASTDHIDEFARFVKDTVSTGLTSDGPQTLKAWLDLAEAYRITQALRECRGNRSAAARLLGIGRRTLYAKMDKLGITATWRVS